jgi:hypothetical protein
MPSPLRPAEMRSLNLFVIITFVVGKEKQEMRRMKEGGWGE